MKNFRIWPKEKNKGKNSKTKETKITKVKKFNSWGDKYCSWRNNLQLFRRISMLSKNLPWKIRPQSLKAWRKVTKSWNNISNLLWKLLQSNLEMFNKRFYINFPKSKRTMQMWTWKRFSWRSIKLTINWIILSKMKFSHSNNDSLIFILFGN